MSETWEASWMKGNRLHDSQGHRIHCDDCASLPALFDLILNACEGEGDEWLQLCRDCLQDRANARDARKAARWSR